MDTINKVKNRVQHLIDELKELNTEYQLTSITSPQDAVESLQLRFIGKEIEEFVVLYLNSKNKIIDSINQVGTVNKANVYIRDIAKQALLNNAISVIIAHNHPSGSMTPSEQDLAVTKKIQKALGLFDINVLDHFIIGSFNGEYLSFSESGLL
jgi:DNA repair protein RadC